MEEFDPYAELAPEREQRDLGLLQGPARGHHAGVGAIDVAARMMVDAAVQRFIDRAVIADLRPAAFGQAVIQQRAGEVFGG